MKQLSMLRTILIAIIVLSSISSFSQMGIGQLYNANDTTRWFILDRVNEDSCIQLFIMTWGQPDRNSIGNISWKAVSIPPIDYPVNIRLFDGISTITASSMNDVYFKDQNDKLQRLGNLESNQSRITEVRFEDQSGKNIVNSDALENLIKTYLMSIIKN